MLPKAFNIDGLESRAVRELLLLFNRNFSRGRHLSTGYSQYPWCANAELMHILVSEAQRRVYVCHRANKYRTHKHTHVHERGNANNVWIVYCIPRHGNPKKPVHRWTYQKFRRLFCKPKPLWRDGAHPVHEHEYLMMRTEQIPVFWLVFTEQRVDTNKSLKCALQCI